MSKAVVSSTIGYPRIGANREMKRALEAFWSSKISEEDLQNAFEAVETAAWEAQAQAGIDLIALDSTLFDQVLDFVDYLGLYPRRFKVRVVCVVGICCLAKWCILPISGSC